MSELLIDYFHDEHSDNVELSADRREATRRSGFQNGLCALAEAMAPPDAADARPRRVSFLVTRTDARWTGGLSLGVSPLEPPRAGCSSDTAATGSVFAQVPQAAVARRAL